MKYIIGIDECGYGAFAGELFVGGIRAPYNWSFPGLRDSKKLSPTQRALLTQELYKLINAQEIKIHIFRVSNTIIDQKSLGVCHKTGIGEVIKNLYSPDDEVVLDGNLRWARIEPYIQGFTNESINFKSVIKADDKYPTVSAASIIIKHTRDQEMIRLSEKYPQYEWNKNMGYGNPEHKEAIKKYGFCDLHRRSYNIKL